MNPSDYIAALEESDDMWKIARKRDGGQGLCKGASEALCLLFSELSLKRGQVILEAFVEDPAERSSWGHWWCVAPDGTIVDPTRGQFPGPIRYEEFDVAPTGKCLYCGEFRFTTDVTCSNACSNLLRASLEVPPDVNVVSMWTDPGTKIAIPPKRKT